MMSDKRILMVAELMFLGAAAILVLQKLVLLNLPAISGAIYKIVKMVKLNTKKWRGTDE